jgi:hypothetical protein
MSSGSAGGEPSTRDSHLPVPVARPPADLVELLGQLVRAAFGVAALAGEIALRGVGAVGRDPSRTSQERPVGADAMDATLGLAWTAAAAGGWLAAAAARVGRPVVAVALRPPLVPAAWQPASAVEAATSRWQSQRAGAVDVVAGWAGSMVPDAAELAVGLVDVDRVVEVVLRHVDATRLAADVLARTDVDAVAGAAVAALDIDALVAHVLRRLDLDRLVNQVLTEIDLSQLDLRRVDLTPVIDQVLDQLDLTQLVLQRVDLSQVVDRVLDQLDLTQLVLQRVDLASVAETVIDEVDLPAIVRDSTGSLAAGTVTGIRLQSIDADRAVSRLVDRLLLRGRPRRTSTPQPPDAQP